MNTEDFKTLVVSTFVLSRGKYDHQEKIIDYILTFYKKEDFSEVDYSKAFEEIHKTFTKLQKGGNHPSTMSDPGTTIGDAVRYFEESIENLTLDSIEQRNKRESLLPTLFLGFLERDTYYLSLTNEEARESARKSDFRDKILKEYKGNPDEPITKMWLELHKYFKSILDKTVDIDRENKGNILFSIKVVASRWPNYHPETNFFQDEAFGSHILKFVEEELAEIRKFNLK